MISPQTTILQKDCGKWRYCKYPKELKWSVLEDDENLVNLENLVLNQHSIIILPTTTELTIIDKENIPILVTKGTKDIIQHYLKTSNTQIWEINEKIDRAGDRSIDLEEPEINKALRFLFSLKTRMVYVILANACINPLHQKSLKNILFTAGVKTISPGFPKIFIP